MSWPASGTDRRFSDGFVRDLGSRLSNAPSGDASVNINSRSSSACVPRTKTLVNMSELASEADRWVSSGFVRGLGSRLSNTPLGAASLDVDNRATSACAPRTRTLVNTSGLASGTARRLSDGFVRGLGSRLSNTPLGAAVSLDVDSRASSAHRAASRAKVCVSLPCCDVCNGVPDWFFGVLVYSGSGGCRPGHCSWLSLPISSPCSGSTALANVSSGVRTPRPSSSWFEGVVAECHRTATGAGRARRCRNKVSARRGRKRQTRQDATHQRGKRSASLGPPQGSNSCAEH